MSNSSFAVVSIDPNAEYEWNRCSVREVFSTADIDLKHLVTTGLEKGDYLVRLTVSVEIIQSRFEQEPERLESEALKLERDFAQAIEF